MNPLPRLMFVTNRHRAAPRDIVEVVTAAVKGGIKFVQLREKDLPAGELLRLAQRLRDVTYRHALLTINDRVDVAMTCDADGVHLGEASLPVGTARRLIGQGKLVGRSVHSVSAAIQAEYDGADYLVAGTIFNTVSHLAVVPQGLDFLQEVCDAVQIPVFAIGGVTSLNARDCIDAGAHGIAVIGEIVGADDVKRKARELVMLLK